MGRVEVPVPHFERALKLVEAEKEWRGEGRGEGRGRGEGGSG